MRLPKFSNNNKTFLYQKLVPNFDFLSKKSKFEAEKI